MIWFFTPYSFEKKLFEAWDNYMALVTNIEDWVCMMDGDVLFFHADFGHQLQRYIDHFPDTAIFTCYASRSGTTRMMRKNNISRDPNLLNHKKRANFFRENFVLQIENLNQFATGHLLMMQKKKWLEIREAVFEKTKNKNILGIDKAIGLHLLELGKKIRLMKSIYVLHYYRFLEGAKNKKHIQVMKEEKKGIDLVYILGSGSKWQNNEIRFSIRSFVMHFYDLRNIIIVGEKPRWAQNIIHIPCADDMSLNKDGRMLKKITAACEDSRVSENFIKCSDDMFLNYPVRFQDFKGWHEGPIIYNVQQDLNEHLAVGSGEKKLKSSKWYEYVYATGMELKKRGLPDFNYDRAHAPQPYNKTEFLKIIKEWDYKNNQYTISNLYMNSSKIFPGEDITGFNIKFYRPVNADKLNGLLKNKIVFNCNDRGLTPQFKNLLAKKFPVQSKYEKTPYLW